jgi:hypothetical protein
MRTIVDLPDEQIRMLTAKNMVFPEPRQFVERSLCSFLDIPIEN